MTTRWPARRLVTALLLAMAAATLAGCARTASARFYILHSQSSETVAGVPPCQVHVQAVTVPSYLETPYLVRSGGEQQIERREFDRWGEPLADGIARVLAVNLSRLTGVPATMDKGGAVAAATAITLQVRILTFEPQHREAVCEVQWALSAPDRPAAWRQSRYVAPLPDDSAASQVAALAQLLDQFSRDIAQALVLPD